jgi:hypothetical protein
MCRNGSGVGVCSIYNDTLWKTFLDFNKLLRMLMPMYSLFTPSCRAASIFRGACLGSLQNDALSRVSCSSPRIAAVR